MSSQVILYDLANKQDASWSPNPWKTRMILNYKNIDYKTEWVEYPDLAPKFKSFGLPPNDPDSPGYFADYTSPAIKYPDGTYGMDSWPIAHELEKRYPNPPLHLDAPIVVKVRDHIKEMLMSVAPHLFAKVPATILHPVSAKYFNETREKMFGISLQEMERTGATEGAWKNVEVPAKEVARWLKEDGSGPYFLGQTVSYADLILVSFLEAMRRIGPEVFERYMAIDEALPRVYDACKQWLEKDD